MTSIDDDSLHRPFLGDARERLSARCYLLFPCLADPARRSSLCLKVALLSLHVIIVGFLFLFDVEWIQNTRKDPWYTAIYLMLFVATLVQYVFTSGSSPGYVFDAMKAGNGTHASYFAPPRIPIKDNLLQNKMEVQLLPQILTFWEEVLERILLHG